jgi:hypothetical protein
VCRTCFCNWIPTVRHILAQTRVCTKCMSSDHMRIKVVRGVFVFRCSSCKGTSSVKTNTWFSGCRISFVAIFYFVYFWCKGMNRKGIKHKASISSESTVTDWSRFCRDVCVLSSLETRKHSLVAKDLKLKSMRPSWSSVNTTLVGACYRAGCLAVSRDCQNDVFLSWCLTEVNLRCWISFWDA